MQFTSALTRSIPLAAAFCFLAQGSEAQSCTGTVTADVAQVSLATGGVQTLSLSVAPADTLARWQVLGSFGNGSTPPFLAGSGLLLDFDRYLLGMYVGGRAFVQGGTTGVLGGPVVSFDAAGNGQVQVVVPQGLPSSFVGRTLYHGMYATSYVTFYPTCGTAMVPLVLAP